MISRLATGYIIAFWTNRAIRGWLLMHVDATIEPGNCLAESFWFASHSLPEFLAGFGACSWAIGIAEMVSCGLAAQCEATSH